MAEKENIITRVYDLLLYLVPQLAKFPRSQKFLLGDRIQVLHPVSQNFCEQTGEQPSGVW